MRRILQSYLGASRVCWKGKHHICGQASFKAATSGKRNTSLTAHRAPPQTSAAHGIASHYTGSTLSPFSPWVLL